MEQGKTTKPVTAVKSIVLSTIDTDQSMIGNINKGEDRRKKETVAFSFIFFSAACNRDSLGIL